MIKKVFLFLTALIFATGLYVNAGEKITATSFYIKIMVETPVTGAFVEIAQTAAKRAGMDLAVTILPPNRMGKDFLENKYNMLFPALDVQFPDMSKIIRSTALIDIKKDFAFVRIDDPIVKTIAELKGKRVGLTKGYPYVKALTDSKDFTVDWGESEQNNMEKLAKGRIDVAIGDRRSAWDACRKAGIDNKVKFDDKASIVEQEVYFAFHNDAQGAALEKKFSAAVKSMQDDGTFGAIMNKYLNKAVIKDYDDRDQKLKKGQSGVIQK